jgi:hypothetical protein
VYLANWARFVERVRTGFDGSVFEYTEGVTARAQLHSLLTVWEGSRHDDPVDKVAQVDRAFDDATEPLNWEGRWNPLRKQPWKVLPTPAAKRWWRRPKWLIGSLRDYFERRAAD